MQSILLQEKELQSKLMTQFEEALKNAPKGSIYRRNIRGRAHDYCCVTERGRWRHFPVPKEEREEILQGLRRKRFMQASLPILKNNLKAIEAFLAEYRPFDPAEILSMLPEPYRKLDLGLIEPAEDFDGKKWMAEMYVSNPFFPEGKIYETGSGFKVRSKSESMIVFLLEQYKLAFKYEAPLLLEGAVYYPDFTIRRSGDGKIIYWEHCGMMDEPQYVEKLIRKLAVYARNGIIPGKNLILTFEAAKTPLSLREVERQIHFNLLEETIG